MDVVNPSSQDRDVSVRLTHLNNPTAIASQNWPPTTTPVVSVCCAAYNHEMFIRDCLSGIATQETTFPVEVIVHDDASTDNTAAIIREYEALYPHIIRSIYQTENQYSKGSHPFVKYIIPLVKSKYIAFCECDDYWIDKNKLQMQVDFLEKHPEYSLCWTRFKTLDSTTGAFELDNNSAYFVNNKEGIDFTFEEFLQGWHIGMQTLVFRTSELFSHNNFNNAYYRDIFLLSDLLTLGKGYCINQVTAIYRIHGGGIYSGANQLARAEVGSNTYREIFLAHPSNDYLRRKYINFNRAYATLLLQEGLYHNALNTIAEEIRLSLATPGYIEDLYQYIEQRFYLNAQQLRDSSLHIKQKEEQLLATEKLLNDIVGGWSFRIGRLITLPIRFGATRASRLATRMKRLRIQWHIFTSEIIKYVTPEFVLINRQLKEMGVTHINKRQIRNSYTKLQPLIDGPHKNEPKLIVSLTSYPARIKDVFYTVYSLINQNVQPDILLLWLAEEQFPGRERDLPKNLLALKAYGLTIKWCNDFKSYKKLIPTLHEYPNDIIVTADDDIFYPKDWLESLYHSYLREPHYIHCHRAHRITINHDGKLNKYSAWTLCARTDEASYLNFCTTGGGALYPPGCLPSQTTDSKLFFQLCPTADDIWFWAMSLLTGTKTRIIDDCITEVTFLDPAAGYSLKESEALWQINRNTNDEQIARVIEHFDLMTILSDTISPFCASAPSHTHPIEPSQSCTTQ